MTLLVARVHSLLATKVKCSLGVFTTIRFIENHSCQHRCQDLLDTFRKVSMAWQLLLMLMTGHGSGTPNLRHQTMSLTLTPFQRSSSKWDTKRWRKFLLDETCCLHWAKMSNIHVQCQMFKLILRFQIRKGRCQSWMKGYNRSQKKRKDRLPRIHQITKRCQRSIWPK